MKVEGLKQMSLEEAEGLAGVWWEGLPQALRVTPHPAFLSTPTHRTLREGPGKRNTTEMGKQRGCGIGPLSGGREESEPAHPRCLVIAGVGDALVGGMGML